MRICYYTVHRAIAHLLDLLRPHSKENGGPLSVEHVVYVEGRGNLILEYSPEGATESELILSLLLEEHGLSLLCRHCGVCGQPSRCGSSKP